MTQRGFSIVELMVAIAVGGLLMALVAQLFSRITQSSSRMLRQTEYVFSVPHALMVIDDDISTAFVPRRGWPQPQDEQTEKQEAQQKQQQAKQQADEAAKQKEKRVEQVFYAEARNELLTFFTCITTHTFTQYGVQHPTVVRVIYEVKPHPEQENVYQLWRRETTDIYQSLKALRQPDAEKGYILLDRIKSIKARFFVPEKPKDAEAATEKQEISYQEVTSWGGVEMQQRITDMLPAYVSIDGEVWDEQYSEEMPLSLFIYLYNQPYMVMQQEQKKKQQEQQKKQKEEEQKKKEQAALPQGARQSQQAQQQMPSIPTTQGQTL